MKCYELMKYANNPVGADFAYCNEENLEETKRKFNSVFIDETTKEQYKQEKEKMHIKFLRFATGYPK